MIGIDEAAPAESAEYPEKATPDPTRTRAPTTTPHHLALGPRTPILPRCMCSPMSAGSCASLTLQESDTGYLSTSARPHVQGGSMGSRPSTMPHPGSVGYQGFSSGRTTWPAAFHRQSDVLDNAPVPLDRFAPRDRPWERRRSADRSGCRPSRADVHRVVGLLRCTDGPGVDQSRVVALNRCNGRTERHRPIRNGWAPSPAPPGSCRSRRGCPNRRTRRESRGISAPPPR